MMYVFLLKSISQEAQSRMVPDDASFRVTAENIPSGPAYLKVLLTEFAAATNATSYHICENLHNLLKKMKSLNNDIERLNTYVKVQLADLAAGGQSTMDLIVFLFTSYLSVKDSEFVEYTKLKKSAYDESPPGANTITLEALMSMAATKQVPSTQTGERMASEIENGRDNHCSYRQAKASRSPSVAEQAATRQEANSQH